MGAAKLEAALTRCAWQTGVVVLTAGTRQVRFYGADGLLVGSVGGAGEGPGELGSPAWVGRLRGGSIAVWSRE